MAFCRIKNQKLLFKVGSVFLFILQPRSESCAWQWSGKVIVLVVILIQEIHLLHAEEWQALWEEAGKIGYTSRKSRTACLIIEIPTLVECQWSTILHFINLAVDIHLLALLEVFEEWIELTSHATLNVGIKPKYLSTISKKVSGKSPLEWISEYVMEDIRYYLANTDLTINEISDTLGFPNASFFGKYFKQQLGCTPLEYRNRIKRG